MSKNGPTCWGYEVLDRCGLSNLKVTSTTRKVLRKLRNKGVAILQYDDSPEAQESVNQLEIISGNIGLSVFYSGHKVTVIDEESNDFEVEQTD